MNSGFRASDVQAPAMVNEHTQQKLFLRLSRQTARAQGIKAMAEQAMERADIAALAHIAMLAADIVEGLEDLSEFAGELTFPAV